jgi:hypothetical protein
MMTLSAEAEHTFVGKKELGINIHVQELEKRPSCLATPPSMKKGRIKEDVLTQRSFPNSAVRASRRD